MAHTCTFYGMLQLEKDEQSSLYIAWNSLPAVTSYKSATIMMDFSQLKWTLYSFKSNQQHFTCLSLAQASSYVVIRTLKSFLIDN